MLIRRFFAFVISAFLIFFPAYSYATTSVGGWTATDSLIAGANTTINAAKTAGGKALKSSITVAGSASKVGQYLIKGGGQAAIAFAMVELADGAIDWVLDPANNAVKYKVAATDNGTGVTPNTKEYYQIVDGSTITKCYPASNCIPALKAINSSRNYTHCVDYMPPKNYANCYYPYGSGENREVIYRVPNPDYVAGGGAGADNWKSIPISTVAAKVISNAEAGHAPSQEAVKATALEGFAAGEHDAALDAAATETGTENPPDTENPPKDPTAPAEPFDPSSIIAAINSLKAMLAGILSSITGFFDWVQSPVPPDEEKKDVPFATTGDVGLDSVDRYEQRINFSGQCPANDFSFTMMGVTYAKPIPYHHLCGFLEQIAPWLLAMCYLGVAYFVVENI